MTDNSLNDEIKKLKKETRLFYFLCMFLIMIAIFLIANNTKNMTHVDKKIIKSQIDLAKSQTALSNDIIEVTNNNSKNIIDIKSKLDRFVKSR